MSDYACKEELLELKNKVDKLENEINRLKENKVDSLTLEKTISELKININSISQRMEELSNDRKEDKEMMNSMRIEINKLIETINSANYGNLQIKNSQERMEDKMDSYQENTNKKFEMISSSQEKQRQDVKYLKETIENNLSNTLLRLYREKKSFRIIVKVVTVFVILGLISMFSFFMKNGIPWGDIKNVIDLVK